MEVCVQEQISFNTEMEIPDKGFYVYDKDGNLLQEEHKISSNYEIIELNDGDVVKVREGNDIVVKGRLEDTYNNSKSKILPEHFDRNTYLIDLVDIDDIDSLKYIKREIVLDKDNNVKATYDFNKDDTILYVRDKNIKKHMPIRTENRRNRPWSYPVIGRVGSIIYLHYLDRVENDMVILETKERYGDVVSVALEREITNLVDVNNYIGIGLIPVYHSDTRTEITIDDMKLLIYENGAYGYKIDNQFTPYGIDDEAGYLEIGILYLTDKLYLFCNHRLIGIVEKDFISPTTFRIEHNHFNGTALGKTAFDFIRIYDKYKLKKQFLELI